MADLVFADESGTSGDCKCYSIGALTIPEEYLDTLNETFAELAQKHGVRDELKWNRIRKGHGAVNLALEWLYILTNSRSLSFDIIVVNKSLYRNWQGDSKAEENAFYKTYTQLLRHRARRSENECKVFIDNRTDSYSKQDEVLGIVTNNMLAQLQSQARLTIVSKSDSRLQPAIQLVDILTGAINTSHRMLLEKSIELKYGKKLLIERMSRMLGLDALHYDTWPNDKLNIWHFPIEYRAKPRTVNIRIPHFIPFITSADLEDYQQEG